MGPSTGVEKELVKHQNLPFGGSSIQLLTCGQECTVIVTDRNEIWVAGWNISGMFGLGDSPVGSNIYSFTKVNNFPSDGHAITQLAVGSSHLMVVTGMYIDTRYFPADADILCFHQTAQTFGVQGAMREESWDSEGFAQIPQEL